MLSVCHLYLPFYCSDYLAGKGQHISRAWGDKEHIRQILETFINLNLKRNIEHALDWLEFYNKTMTIILVSLTSEKPDFKDYLAEIKDLGCDQFGGGCVYKLDVVGSGGMVAKCGPINSFIRERVWVNDKGDDSDDMAEEGTLSEFDQKMKFMLSETDMRYILDENEEAEDRDQEEYVPHELPKHLPPPTILIVSPLEVPPKKKKKKQVLLMQEDESGKERPTYKTKPRPRYHRLQPRPQIEKRYEQTLIRKIPVKKIPAKKKHQKKEGTKQYKQEKLDRFSLRPK